MKRWQKLGTCAAAVALVATGSAAWAQGGAGAGAGTTAPVAPFAVHDAAVESKYTAINPCRIVDTRKAGGKLSAGSSRSFVAAGTTGFSGQGGASTGCKIPDAASSIQVTITANSAGGRGYLKAYPDNISAPTATFMNYTSSYHVSVGGAITLDTAGSNDFKVSNYSYSTHVIVDVLGYAVKPMWAYVKANGALYRYSRVVANYRVSAGRYRIDFDRDISNCTYYATPTGYGEISAVDDDTVKNAVWVATRNSAGGDVDMPFYLVVTC